MRTVIAALSVLSALVACTPDGDPSRDGGPGADGGDVTPGEAPFTVVGERILTEVPSVAGRGLAVGIRSDGRWAVAYFQESTAGSFTCLLFAGEENESEASGEFIDVMVAEPDGDGVVTTLVEPVRGAGAQSVDLAVTSDDELVLAYGGGDDANGYCGASDLAFARETAPRTFATSVVATDSGTSSPCRLDAQGEDPYCQIGDTVGLYPSLATGDDGAIAIAYQDFHNAFADKDIYGADLELARSSGGGFSLASISTEVGGGYHTAVAFGAGGRVIAGHEITGSNQFLDENSVPFTMSRGLYVAVEQDDGSFVEQALVTGESTDHRVAVGWHESTGWVAAYHGSDNDDLWFWVSTDDGNTWTPEPVDQVGLTGRSPQLGFLSDGRVVVAYRYCGGPSDGTCNPAVDGVRVALRTGFAQWSKQDLGGDDEELEGIELDMDIAPDDTIAIVSRNSDLERPVLHLLRPR